MNTFSYGRDKTPRYIIELLGKFLDAAGVFVSVEKLGNATLSITYRCDNCLHDRLDVAAAKIKKEYKAKKETLRENGVEGVFPLSLFITIIKTNIDFYTLGLQGANLTYSWVYELMEEIEMEATTHAR